MEELTLPIQLYKGKKVGEWNIVDAQDLGNIYLVLLQKNGKTKIFYIRKPVIKAKSLQLSNDVYELWYKDFEDSKLLTLEEISNIDIVIENMNTLINTYSKFD